MDHHDDYAAIRVTIYGDNDIDLRQGDEKRIHIGSYESRDAALKVAVPAAIALTCPVEIEETP